MTAADRRASWVEPHDESESQFYILVTESQAADIASGYVPTSVKAQVRTMLDWVEEDQRRADRPERPAKRKRSA